MGNDNIQSTTAGWGPLKSENKKYRSITLLIKDY